MKRLFFLTAMFCSLAAQSQTFYGERIKHTFESKAFGDTREIDVYLPFFYQEAPQDSFMVMYVFDGQFDPYLGMAAHTAEYLTGMSEFPSFIAVGIRTKHRPKEFTPAERQPEGEQWGGESHKLEQFLSEEVIPFIDANYRTTSLRLGIGHSLGGTFVSNTVFTNKGLFKGVISISPNMSYDDRQLADNLNNTLTSGEQINAFHFMTAGTVGNMENNFRYSSMVVDSVYRAHPQKSLIWHFETYEGQNHSLTPVQSIGAGLWEFGKILNLSEDSAMAILKAHPDAYAEHAKQFYTDLSNWLGYAYTPTVDEINWIGYIAMGAEKYDQALDVFEWAIKLYPDDANIYDSKGEALENMKRYKESYEYYGIAAEKIKLQKDSLDEESYTWYKENFEKNMNRVKALM